MVVLKATECVKWLIKGPSKNNLDGLVTVAQQ